MEAHEAAVVGASRKFECQVVGYPPPVIRWFKDEAEITYDVRYKFSHEAHDGTVSMHIDNIRLSDAGLYKCRAENCEGYAVTAAHLTVKAAEPRRAKSTATPQSTNEPSVATAAASEGIVKMTVVQEVFQKPTTNAAEPNQSSRRRPLTLQSSTEAEAAPADASVKVKQTAPIFVRKPESTKVTENYSVTLTCRVQGTPKPVVTWFHQGRVLQPDDQKSFSSTEDEHCLIIGRCYTSDAGEYTCTATNAAGAVYCNCTLTVADSLSEEGSSSDSEYSLSYRRLSAVVEEESSTDTLSDKPKLEFLREMIVTTQYVDSGKKITFKPGDAVEILDTAKTDRWLVRSKRDSLQVGYIPRNCLGEMRKQDSAKASDSATEAAEGAEDADAEDSAKAGTKKREEKQLKAQNSKKMAESGGDSSGDDASSPDAEVYPIFVAVADYESAELKICEGQFLEVIDRSNPISWLVRTKPTKTNASRVGMMPASYLEMKDGVGHVDRRSTREVFREDIIQITDKQTEASVKRRYALAELLESENDYIADLEELIDKLKADQTAQLPERERVLEELAEFHSFHKESFLPDLMQCTGVPADVADAFISWKSGKSVSEGTKSQQHFETPLSHIRKYQSLLKDFIRYTTRSGGDCEKLEKALNMLLYVTKCIDDQEVMHQLKDCPPEVRTQKPLLRHESITMSCSDEDSSKGKDRHLFLFPESLLITRVTKTASLTEEYQYKESLVLKNLKLNDSVSTDDKKFELFYVSEDGHHEMYVVQSKNDFSKEAWLRDLENLLRAQGVENCYITEQEKTEFLQKKASSESAAVAACNKQEGAASAPPYAGSTSQALGDYSTGGETDQYLTAAESEMSSYCTAQESADDEIQDSGSKDGTSRRQLNDGRLPTAPTFVEQLIPTVSEDGVSATFVCTIAGKPTPDVSWYCQGKTVTEDGHYSLAVNDRYQYSMIIHDLTVDDAGLYTIKAVNIHGEVSSTAELKVDPPTSASCKSSSATAAAASAATGTSLAAAAPAAACTAQTSGTAADATVAETAHQATKAPGQEEAALAAATSSNAQPPTVSSPVKGDPTEDKATDLNGSAQSTVMLSQSPNDNYVATLNAADSLDSKITAEQGSQRSVIEAARGTVARATQAATKAATATAATAATTAVTGPQKAKLGEAGNSDPPKISPNVPAEKAGGSVNNQPPTGKQQQLLPNMDAESSSANESTEEEDEEEEEEEVPAAAADEQTRSPASHEVQSAASEGNSLTMSGVNAGEDSHAIDDEGEGHQGATTPEVPVDATCTAGDSQGSSSMTAGLQAGSQALPVQPSSDRPKPSAEVAGSQADATEGASKSTSSTAAVAAAAAVSAIEGCNPVVTVVPADDDDTSLHASDEQEEGRADAANNDALPDNDVEQRKLDDGGDVDEDKHDSLSADGAGTKRGEHHSVDDGAPAQTPASSSVSQAEASAGTEREQRSSTARSISDDWSTGLSSDDSESGKELQLRHIQSTRQARQYSRVNADADLAALPPRRGRTHAGYGDDDDDYEHGVTGSGRRPDESGEEQHDLRRQRASRPGSVPAPRRAATVGADDRDGSSELRQAPRRQRRGSAGDDMPEAAQIRRTQARELESPTLASPFRQVGSSLPVGSSPSAHITSRSSRQLSLPPPTYATHKRAAPPAPVGEKPEIKQAGADQFVLFWLPPESHKDKQLNISYIVEYRSTADPDWRRLARSVRESYVKLDIPTRETQYRIRAENEYGLSDPSLIVSGPWKRPKVERSISITTSFLATPPSVPRVRAAVRRARARSCDGRLANAHRLSPSVGSEQLLNVYSLSSGQQHLTLGSTRRSRSSEREPGFSSMMSSPLSSSEFRLSRRHAHLNASLRHRLGDLEHEMTSEVESILSESRHRVATAASRRADRYRSRSECRQLSPSRIPASLTRLWDDEGLAAIDWRAAAQRRLVMPTTTTQDRISLEPRDYARMDGSAYLTFGKHERSSDVRGGSSYLSSYTRESVRSDYEYAEVARRAQQHGSSAAQYQADSSAHYYHRSTMLDGHRASPAVSRSGGSHGRLSLPPSRSYSPAMSSPRNGAATRSSLDGDFLAMHGSGRNSSVDRTLSVRAGDSLGKDQYELVSSAVHETASPTIEGESLADEPNFVRGMDSFYWTGGLFADRSASLEGDSGSDISIRSAPDEDFALAPRFAKNRDADEQYAIEGRTARVVCTVYTHSRSTVSWYKDDAKILVGGEERYNSFVYPSGLCLLQFDDMKWEDSGTYEIFVKNDYGSASRRIRLKVADPPTFLELPLLAMKLHRFDGLKISCKVDGIPPPRVSFFKDAQKIACSPRVQIERADNGVWSLNVKNALLRDAGDYVVVAENVAGQNRFSVLVNIDERFPGPQIDQTSGYFFEDHYYLQEEVDRDSNCTVNRVIEKSSGLEFYAYTYRDLTTVARRRYWQKLNVARAVTSDAVINIINIIENDSQFIVVTEITGMKLCDHMLLMPSWSENLVAYYIQQLLSVSESLSHTGVTLASLQLDNVYVSSINHKIKVDVYEAGWRLTSAAGRSEYSGAQSMFSAPEAAAGEVCAVTGMWNVGVIAYLLLGGVPQVQDDSSINVDVESLFAVSPDARDFITRLLQRETRERLRMEEAARHPWLRCAAADNFGIKLDLSRAQEFIVIHQEQHGLLPRHLRRCGETSSVRPADDAAAELSPHEEAWLTGWFSDYELASHGDAYAVPLHELSLPLSLRSSHYHLAETHEDEEAMWCVRTLHMRDQLENKDVRAGSLLAIELKKSDLVALAIKGLAHIEHKVPTAWSRQEPDSKPLLHFCRKLEPTAFQPGSPFTLSCRLEYLSGSEIDPREALVSWYKNEELIAIDVRSGSTAINDHYELSHYADGRLELRLRRAATLHDAGSYRCVARLEKSTASTRCWLLAGDIPSRPGRPVASCIRDGVVHLAWAQPASDNNSYVRFYRVDYKAADDIKWTTCSFTTRCSSIITDLPTEIAHRFRISAVNQFGYGAYSVASAEVCAVTAGPGGMHLSHEEVKSIISEQIATNEHSADMCRPSTPTEDCQYEGSRSFSGVQLELLNPKQVYRFTEKPAAGGLHECWRFDDRRSYSYRLVNCSADSLKELEFDGSLGRHPHLVKLLDAYRLPSEHLLLIYERTSSETMLQRLVRTTTHYGEGLVKDIVRQLADAMEYLHCRGAVHMGVHPDNVVMADGCGWRVMLTGFDCTRCVTREGMPKKSSAPATKFVEFAAPEVIFDEAVSSATDVWGLGVIAFVLVCGRSPFYSPDEQDMLERIRNVRYWTGDQAAMSSLVQAQAFLFQTLKRLPSNRLSTAATVNHGWLTSAPTMSSATTVTEAAAVPTAAEFSSRRLQRLVARLEQGAASLEQLARGSAAATSAVKSSMAPAAAAVAAAARATASPLSILAQLP